MCTMILASLILNILVLIPVTGGIIRNTEWVKQAYGEDSPGRRILLAVYMVILIASVGFLFFQDEQYEQYILALFVFQIFYKLITPITTRTLRNPVVVSNLGIALFHSVTVYLMIYNA